MYKKLIEFYENGDLSFKHVKTFNMDEYVGKMLLSKQFICDIDIVKNLQKTFFDSLVL